MRTLVAVLTAILLSPAVISNPEQTRIPTVSADTVRLGVVRRASEIGPIAALGGSRDTLLVERPAAAREGAASSVFVVEEGSGMLRRVQVRYGRASTSLIQMVSGVSPGDRIIVSDMREWEAFDQLRLR